MDKRKDIIANHCRCPICSAPLSISVGTVSCLGERKHCYDFSSSGYINLAIKQTGAGDSKDAVKARKSFLDAGYYRPIAEKICYILKEYPCKTIADAGCGEGFYSNYIAKELNSDMIGFDLSKFAIEYASKFSKQNDISSAFVVANLFDLPLTSSSIDTVINIFAPCAEKEFHRVLKENGILVVCGAGTDHLLQLKQLIYEDVYVNGKRSDLPSDNLFELLDTVNLKYEIELTDNTMINNLFSMTPYYWRTKLSDKKKFEGVEYLKTIVEVEFMIYRKK